MASERKTYTAEFKLQAVKMAERQREQAEEAAASDREKIEVLQPLTVTPPPIHLPAGRTVLRIDGATVGYEPAGRSSATCPSS